jgi:serine/threonine-protein kinase
MPTPGTRTGSLVGGRYRLGRSLGQGGMGEVYEAVQENLGKRVAVKLLHAQLAHNAGLLARFKREAEAAARLGHANIVEVFDFGVDADGTPFLVMELLAGESLGRTLASQGRLSQARVAFIAAQVLAALAAAHASGFVHRDLKPDNIFLTSVSGVNDIVKLLDFGIAKLTDESTDAKLTNTGAVLGTPQYMSPEQARGRSIDARSDLYAMGVVMYEALTGRVPFTAENYNAILFAILEDDPTPLASMRPDLEPAFVEIVQRAMARKPESRFSDAAAMRTALLPFATVSVGTSAIRSEPPPALANDFVTAPTIATPQSAYTPPNTPSASHATGSASALATPSASGAAPLVLPNGASPAPDVATAPTAWSAPPRTPAPKSPSRPNFPLAAAPQTNRVKLRPRQAMLWVGALAAAGLFVRAQFRRAEHDNERVIEQERRRIEARVREAAGARGANEAQASAASVSPSMPGPPAAPTLHATTPSPAAMQPSTSPRAATSRATTSAPDSGLVHAVAAPIASSVIAAAPAIARSRRAQWSGGRHNNVYDAGWADVIRPQLRRIDHCVSRADYRPVGDSGFDAIIAVTPEGRAQSVRIVEQMNAPQQTSAVLACMRNAIGHIEFGEGRGGEIEVDFIVIPRDR